MTHFTFYTIKPSESGKPGVLLFHKALFWPDIWQSLWSLLSFLSDKKSNVFRGKASLMSPTNLGNFLHFYTLKNRMTKRWAESISLKKVKKLLRLKVLFVLQEKMDVGQFHFCPLFNYFQFNQGQKTLFHVKKNLIKHLSDR